MEKILEDIPKTDYKIYIIHQKDNRQFNRGAMKNIGFIYAKNKYPFDYKNITFVFNDVDTMPKTKNLIDYNTTPGNIKHFYGFRHTLGGIVSIKGSDFENMNGFANFWAWGYEDNILNKRAIDNNINIDRSQFFDFLNTNIIQSTNGNIRLVNRGEYDRYYNNTNEGINNITNLDYMEQPETNFIDVLSFETGMEYNPALNKYHDLRNGSRPFQPLPARRQPRMSMVM